MKVFLVTIYLFCQLSVTYCIVPAVAFSDNTELRFASVVKETRNKNDGTNPPTRTGNRAAVTWSKPCGSSEGGKGTGTAWGLEFEGCAPSPNQTCSIVTSSDYKITLGFIPGKDETAITMNLTAIAQSPESDAREIIASYEFKYPPYLTAFAYSLEYSNSVEGNNFKGMSGLYDLQVKLFSPNDNSNIVCLSFPVSVTYDSGGTGNASLPLLIALILLLQFSINFL